MPDEGGELGVDLYRLATVANDDLPTVAEIYRDATRNVASAAEPIGELMRRPSALGGGTSTIYAAWYDLCTTTSRFLSDTGDNLSDTALALNMAISHYRETDEKVKAAFDEMVSQNGSPAADLVN